MSKVEDKMKNQEIDYEEILNDLNIGYYKGEIQGEFRGKIIKHNKAFSKIFGYELSESLIGFKTSDFYYDKEEQAKYYKELLKKGFIQNLPVRMKNKKNEVIILQINSHLIRDNRGIPLFFEGTFVDITEKSEIQQKLKESEDRFKSITDQSLVSIIIIQDDVIKYINNQLIELAGYSKEEVGNWKPRDFIQAIHPEDRAFALEQAIKKQTGKKDVINQYEMRLIKKNGETMWVDNYAKTINYDGRPADMAVLIDITKRKETEQKLKNSENKYKLITENANDMIAVVNNKFEYEYINEEISYKSTGYRKEDVIGKSVFEFIHPDDVIEVNRVLNEGLKKGEASNVFRFRHKNGNWIWLESKGKVFLNEMNQIKGLIVSRDITERKTFDDKIRESEKKYKDLSQELEIILDIIPGMIFCKNKSGKTTRVNKPFADSLNLKKEEIVGKTSFDLFPKEQAEAFQKDDLEVINTGMSKLNIEEIVDFPGKEIYSMTQKLPLTNDQGDIVGLIGLAIDITERRNIEQKLKESEEKYRELIETAQLGFWIIDTNAHTIYVNKKMAEILGYTEDEMIGKHIFNFMDEKEIENIKIRPESIKLDVKKRYNLVFLKKDGSKVITSLETSPLFNKDGNFNGSAAIITDITDQKRAEESLKESEEKYRNLYEEAPNAYFSIGVDKRIIKCNKAAEKLLGYSKAELLEMKVFNLYAKNEYGNEKAKKIFENFLKGNIIQDEELLMQKKDGENLWISLSVKPMFDKEGHAIESRSMVININERKKVEEKLKESEKKYRDAYDKANFYKELIAHDMNNILHTIESSMELFNLFQKNPENVKYQKNVFDIISSQIFRGSNLVSNIIKLSEIEETKFPTKVIEAKRILNNSIEHINRSYQGLKLNIKIETDLIKIYLKANELLSDLFENLLINAVKHNENPEIEIQINISEEISNKNNCIKFEFIDNGIGIPDEIKQDLFEKSIDRKSRKKGLGIGLSLVRQIVSSYNGKILIKNRIEGDYKKGSNFVVLIPSAE